MKEIKLIKASTIGTKPQISDSELGFGKYTTDHMFLMDYESGKGWYDPRIVPYQPLTLDPCAMVLHYNQEVFEGLKAYHLADGGVGLFRPEKNIIRMNASARRLVMPEVDQKIFIDAIKQLVLLDRDWLPTSKGTSIYIRPTIIATEPALGVRPSNQYLFFIVMGPVGPYYPEGFKPTRILVTHEYVRAAEGGVGFAKTSSNYGPTLIASKMASEKGYTQVLWLDSNERKYIEEVGTSNIFFNINGEIVTPPLGGTILPGVTRESVLQLARYWDLKVSERRITIDEIIDGCKNGNLKEIFATGTAAIISPVGVIGYLGEDYQVGNGQTGDFSKRFYDELISLQYGHKTDPFGWCVRIA